MTGIRDIKKEFPVFERNPGLVFLDSGASAQKPRVVIDGLAEFYRSDYANVHRGVYQLSQRSTDRFEAAREAVRAFLNAADDREIVFVRGATEGINLVAQAWGGKFLKAGDEIVISDLEHHSNLVPWQMACEKAGAKLVVAPTDETGGFDLGAFEALLSPPPLAACGSARTDDPDHCGVPFDVDGKDQPAPARLADQDQALGMARLIEHERERMPSKHSAASSNETLCLR